MTERTSGQLPEDPLKQLKEILLKEDEKQINALQDELDRLKTQLNDKERLIDTLEPVMTDLLDRKIHNSKDEMAEALAPVMGEAIRRQVHEAKEDVVDALYPVIGRMITKAISEAMKKLVENVNQQLNTTLNVKLWIKRLKARLLGIDAGEMIVSENVQFELQELFLIDIKYIF